jgi:hypothetical protein
MVDTSPRLLGGAGVILHLLLVDNGRDGLSPPINLYLHASAIHIARVSSFRKNTAFYSMSDMWWFTSRQLEGEIFDV